MSANVCSSVVRTWLVIRGLPTYEPAPPDRNPMFLEKRVYQGSSGKVYPLPFTDRVAKTKTDRAWQTIWIENEFLRVMILPALGGRIQIVDDWPTNRKLALAFEALVGKGRLLVTRINLSDPVRRQLRANLIDYAAGPRFDPAATLTAGQIRNLSTP